MASCGTLTVVSESESDSGGDETSDTSQLVLESAARQSQIPGEITVNYTVLNQITAGDGQTLTASVDIDLDGETVKTDYIGEVAPGQEPSGTYVITGVSAGDHEVCVKVY